jgi:hypothetical protein
MASSCAVPMAIPLTVATVGIVFVPLAAPWRADSADVSKKGRK